MLERQPKAKLLERRPKAKLLERRPKAKLLERRPKAKLLERRPKLSCNVTSQVRKLAGLFFLPYPFVPVYVGQHEEESLDLSLAAVVAHVVKVSYPDTFCGV